MKKIDPKKTESFFQWTIGIVFILFMIAIAALPYLAIRPENLFTKGLTFVLCVFLLLVEIMVVGLMFSKIRDTQ